MHRFSTYTAIMVLAVALLATVGPAQAQTSGTTVLYQAGWNLVALPPGTVLAGTSGTLDHWLTNADSYQTLDAGQETRPAVGYWAYFPSATQVTLAPGGTGAYEITPRAGHFVMIGDPGGSLPATVTGADAVYTYDPASGYQSSTTLPPGQGAWAVSLSGTAVTITPQGQLFPTPVSSSLQTISGPQGFSVGVPAGWVSATPQATQPYEVLRMRAVDGSAEAGVFVLSPAVGASLDPIQELTAFTQRFIAQPESTNVNIIAAAQPVSVPNASAAALSSVRYEFDGVPRRDTFVAAVQGQTVYVLDVVVSGPYLTQPAQAEAQIINPIVSSFRVTG